MSHTIYDLKYHFAELGNKVGDGIITRNVEVEQIQVRKWAASCSKIFQVSRLKSTYRQTCLAWWEVYLWQDDAIVLQSSHFHSYVVLV